MAISKIQSESLNLADTYAFTGTVTGAGEANTPSFHCGQSTTQTLSNSTFTKITFDATETLDSDNAFASSRFTPQTAGYYYIYGSLRLHGTTDFDNMNVSIYKNGSSDSDRVLDTQGSHHHYETKKVNGIVYLNGSSDYVELYGRQTSGQTLNLQGNLFGGYKLF